MYLYISIYIQSSCDTQRNMRHGVRLVQRNATIPTKNSLALNRTDKADVTHSRCRQRRAAAKTRYSVPYAIVRTAAIVHKSDVSSRGRYYS